MAKVRQNPVECLGGPSDGDFVEMDGGAREFCVRIAGRWHRYWLTPQEDGMALVYQGIIERRREAADPVS